MNRWISAAAAFALLLACSLQTMAQGIVQPAQRSLAVSTSVVISQVYGGGGSTGAVYQNDFVELFNRGSQPASLDGWSVQYASATGNGNFGGNPVTALTGTIQPGQYYLVQLAGGGNGSPLPPADAAGTVNLSGTSGKVIVASTDGELQCNGGSTLCNEDQLALIVDLVGYGTANFYEGSAAAPALSVTTAGLRKSGGCVETDQNSTDFEAGAPNPRNTASPLSPCGVDSAPSVVSITPADGAAGVALGANLSLSFNEPVTLSPGWFSLSCDSGPRDAVVSGGPSAYQLDPDADFAPGETCTFSINPALVSDEDMVDPPDTMSGPFSSSFGTIEGSAACQDSFTPAFEIQGSGDSTPLNGSQVTTQGVVVSDNEGPSPALRGFYLQDPAGDGSAATSDAIFVFHADQDSVGLGDLVRVTGTAGEFSGQTQVTASSVAWCASGQSVVPLDLTLPFSVPLILERYEGMLVRLPQTLSVTEHFQLARYGQVTLSSGGRLSQPTDVALPGPDALAVQALNDRSRILVDDGLSGQNLDPILFGRGGNPLTAANTLRGGDTVTGLVGILAYGFGDYRIYPVDALGGGAPVFQPANPRPTAPEEVGGSLKVAGMNLLNYFNSFTGCTGGVGGAPLDCRGADSAAEFERQWPKTVAGILATGADVIGLVEIENDGYGSDSAIQDLVNRLNAAAGAGTFAFIDVDTATGQVNALGTDAIKVGLIYRPAKVVPVGSTAALNTASFVTGGDGSPRNRPALAQAFQQVSNGEILVISVNHLKSKSSACDLPDQNDGQGDCAAVRAAAAGELAAWLADDPTGTGDPDALILGDLNAYLMEDAVRALASAGYTDLAEQFQSEEAYSYAFDGQWGSLDHALASPSLLSQVTGAAEFHINADEPLALDYNTEFKNANQQNILYAPDAYRMADHDPMVVGLALVQKTWLPLIRR